ncbi:hypothetical protein [Methanoplanus limicola]|nr:hypothetical protein [Methanoplanus limicola]
MMKIADWEIKLGVILICITLTVYSLKFIILQNPGDTVNYIFNSFGFLPMNVLLVTVVLNKLLSVRSKKDKMDKLNMVIGTFFSEVGTGLMSKLSSGDSAIEDIRKELIIKGDFSEDDFERVRKNIKSHSFTVNISDIDVISLESYLSGKRDFMIRLLENPVLLEHEDFTELLRAVFHLEEELQCRDDFACLPSTDFDHLNGDINRAYGKLVFQWLDYMSHLQERYPYLFSLMIRTNPFDDNASPVVK